MANIKKSHEMTSLQEFAKQRQIRNKRMQTLKKRKGYSISLLEGEHMNTYQICIYLRNTETLKEAETNAKEAIKILRHRLGRIV